MQLDVVDLLAFYRTPLGRMVISLLGKKLIGLWPGNNQNRLVGFGFATPYLEPFLKRYERVVAFMPAGQGVCAWPRQREPTVGLVDMEALPLADSSVDQILMVHVLEVADNPASMLQEIWRVLSPGGKVLIVVPARRGVWARFDTSPFGYGQPFSRNQLHRLLQGSLFQPSRWDGAFYLPPTKSRFVLRAARSWERVGHRLWPAFPGVLIVEATKQLYEGLPSPAPFKVRALQPALRPAATT